MPRPSKCDLLPEEVKTQLNQKLVEQAFSRYEDLSEWLDTIGYEISKSAIHRYGKEFKSQLEAIKLATEQAKAIAEVCDDDANLLGDALNRLAQQKAFRVLQEVEPADDVDFTRLVSAIATLNRSSSDGKKFKTQMQKQAKKTAEEVEKVAQDGGLSADTISAIKSKILGIGQDS